MNHTVTFREFLAYTLAYIAGLLLTSATQAIREDGDWASYSRAWINSPQYMLELLFWPVAMIMAIPYWLLRYGIFSLAKKYIAWRKFKDLKLNDSPIKNGSYRGE